MRFLQSSHKYSCVGHFSISPAFLTRVGSIGWLLIPSMVAYYLLTMLGPCLFQHAGTGVQYCQTDTGG